MVIGKHDLRACVAHMAGLLAYNTLVDDKCGIVSGTPDDEKMRWARKMYDSVYRGTMVSSHKTSIDYVTCFHALESIACLLCVYIHAKWHRKCWATTVLSVLSRF